MIYFVVDWLICEINERKNTLSLLMGLLLVNDGDCFHCLIEKITECRYLCGAVYVLSCFSLLRFFFSVFCKLYFTMFLFSIDFRSKKSEKKCRPAKGLVNCLFWFNWMTAGFSTIQCIPIIESHFVTTKREL